MMHLACRILGPLVHDSVKRGSPCRWSTCAPRIAFYRYERIVLSLLNNTSSRNPGPKLLVRTWIRLTSRTFLYLNLNLVFHRGTLMARLGSLLSSAGTLVQLGGQWVVKMGFLEEVEPLAASAAPALQLQAARTSTSILSSTTTTRNANLDPTAPGGHTWRALNCQRR